MYKSNAFLLDNGNGWIPIPKLQQLVDTPAHGIAGIRALYQAFSERIIKILAVQIPANEDQPVGASFSRSPGPAMASRWWPHSQHHVDSLENVSMRASLNRKKPFRAENIISKLLKKCWKPHFQLVNVAFSFAFNAHTLDRFIMLMVLIWIQKLRIHIHNSVQFKSSYIQDFLERHSWLRRLKNWCGGIDGLDSLFHSIQFLWAYKIQLVENDTVCECNLLDRFVFDALLFFFI